MMYLVSIGNWCGDLYECDPYFNEAPPGGKCFKGWIRLLDQLALVS